MTGLCFYPGCDHLNDDVGRTDLCATHFSALDRAISARKRETGGYRKGHSLHTLAPKLRRMEILRLLGVDEEPLMRTVSQIKPLRSFEESRVGSFSTEEEGRRLKFSQFKGGYYSLGGGKKMAFCSVFFTDMDEAGVNQLIMFRTREKQSSGELQKEMAGTVIPRLREIVFARRGYKYSEWGRHVPCEGYYYHDE